MLFSHFLPIDHYEHNTYARLCQTRTGGSQGQQGGGRCVVASSPAAGARMLGQRIVHISEGRHARVLDPIPWRERFRTVVDLAGDAFVEIDASGVVTEWNRQAELLFGWSRDEVVGRPIGAFLVPSRFAGA